jgi:tRNAThr (cytosine32-N3)-methyltransferase
MEEEVIGPHNRSRHLGDEDQVWEHNCWDDVPWDAEKEAEAEEIVKAQRENSVLYQQRKGNLERVAELQAAAEHDLAKKKWLKRGPKEEDLSQAAAKWNEFYAQHERWFFKDRQWLRGEFKELFFDTNVFPAARKIMEVGCGAGNTIFPIWRDRKNDPTLEHIFACDYSAKAVELVRTFRDFNAKRMTAFVHDLAADEFFESVEAGSIDAITAIFVLSALHPDRLRVAFKKLFKALRPGGLLLFRDYGRFDLTQLRLKADRMIDDDFYFRGDGTTVHFFTLEKLRVLAAEAGFSVVEERNDRRLITNRFRKLKMYRNWIQMKFIKPDQQTNQINQ